MAVIVRIHDNDHGKTVRVDDELENFLYNLQAGESYRGVVVQECKLNELREHIMVYEGCQYWEGRCDLCQEADGGCEGWIALEEFDEDVFYILAGLEEDSLLSEEEFRRIHGLDEPIFFGPPEGSMVRGY